MGEQLEADRPILAAGSTDPAELGQVAGWRTRAERDLRLVSAGLAAGAVVGLVVNGIGSRLAMMLLAKLNPQVTGRISDDGFRIGQFDLGNTLGLIAFGTVVGVLGGLVFVALRSLRMGPPWFQTLSMTVGPAIVVGNGLVHTDGIDFVTLQPAWLAILLFVALPGLAALSLVRLGDRWLADDSWFLRTPRAWILAYLTMLPLFGLYPVLIIAVAVHHGYHQAVARGAFQDGPTRGRPVRVVARLALGALFAFSLVDLTGKALVLT